MKRFALLAAGVVLLSTPAFAAMDPYMESALIDVCKSSASNKPLVLDKAVKAYRLDYPTIADKLVCNGLSVYNFALDRGAERTATRIFQRGRMGVVTIEDISMTGSDGRWYVSF